MSKVGKWSPTYTVGRSVSRRGLGLFTGIESELTLSPLSEGAGIVFERIDLPGAPRISMSLSHVQGTPRCTIIGQGECSFQTVEHLMAALYAYEIGDLLVSLSGPEIPIFDGSSVPFIEMLEEAGLVKQGEKRVFALKSPVYFSKGDTHIVAIPSEETRITYTLHYPHSKCIGTQFFSAPLTKDFFCSEIAPCRTFSVYEEVFPLIEKGLLRGGSLENALVIKDEKVMNPEGLRLPFEMVRHKILDMMGDLYLMGISFSAHILAVRSGHYANNAFANELLNHFKGENF